MTSWTDAKYWYFVTGTNMGKLISLEPRTMTASDDEPVNKRICVAPTAAHCMIAIDLSYRINGYGERKGNIYVYRTLRKVKARKPYGVFDSHITKEHWLHTKTRFTLVEILQVSTKHNWTDFKCDDRKKRKDLRAVRAWCKRRNPNIVNQQEKPQ